MLWSHDAASQILLKTKLQEQTADVHLNIKSFITMTKVLANVICLFVSSFYLLLLVYTYKIFSEKGISALTLHFIELI